MYKLLIGTATAALLVTPALAKERGVSVGGYYNSVVYSQDVDGQDTRDLGIHNDAEIIIKGKRKTENGLTIGFEIQLEGEGSADVDDDGAPVDFIDENYIYIRGDFGKVEIGAENNAAYKQQVNAPRFLGWKTYDNNFATWGSASNYDKPLMDGVDGDALKINYYSPKVNGFQFSYSLTPDVSDRNGDTGLYADTGSGSASAYGVKYSGQFNGMKVQASYGLNELDEDVGQNTREDSALGLSVSRGDVTVGGTMLTFDINGAERDILHYGVGYKLTDETRIGVLLHAQEEADGDETNITVLGGSTKLGSGTKLTYSYEMVEDDEDGDSTFLGVGLLLKF